MPSCATAQRSVQTPYWTPAAIQAARAKAVRTLRLISGSSGEAILGLALGRCSVIVSRAVEFSGDPVHHPPQDTDPPCPPDAGRRGRRWGAGSRPAAATAGRRRHVRRAAAGPSRAARASVSSRTMSNSARKRSNILRTGLMRERLHAVTFLHTRRQQPKPGHPRGPDGVPEGVVPFKQVGQPDVAGQVEQSVQRRLAHIAVDQQRPPAGR